MKLTLILLILVLFCLGCTQLIAQDVVHQLGSNALRCTVNLNGPQISPKLANKFVVQLDNESPVAKTMTELTINLNEKPVPTSRFREPQSYYAPVDVESKGALVRQRDSRGMSKYPDRKVILPPRHAIEFPVDIATLLWARNLSSLLPSADLFHVVQDGTYTVSVQIRTDDGVEIHCPSTQLVVSQK